MNRARGAATVEFAVVATLALIPVALAILQLGLLYVAKHTLHHAAFLAARAGAVSHGSRDEMLRYLAKGLVPLYGGARVDLDARNAVTFVPGAYARAFADAHRPDRTRLRVLNPTAASFADFERIRDGIPQIPNAFRGTAIGARSGQTLADANVLKIRVDHCVPLVVPLVDRLLTGTLRRFDVDPFRQQCYAARRLPVVAHALVHAHSALRRGVMDP